MKEIGYLTGLRGVAVSLVLVAHLFGGHSFNKPLAYLGMSLFFMLSGIVLTYTWANKFLIEFEGKIFAENFFSFIWARFARLAPLYLLVAVPYFASSGRSTHEILSLIPRYLLGMQSWFYDVTYSGSIKQLLVYAFSWSISSEIWLYLVFPAILIFLFNYENHKKWLIAISGLLVYFVFIVYITHKNIYTGLGCPPSQTKVDWFVYLSPYGRIIEFTIGIVIGLFLLENREINENKSFHGLLAILILTMIIIYLSINEHKQTTTSLLALLRMGPLFTLPLAYFMISLAKGNDITEDFFSNIFLNNIGKWSYSIYLLGGCVIPLCGGLWMENKIGIVIKSVTQVGIIILFSAGSYQLIETPLRRYILNINPLNYFYKKKQMIVSET